MDADVEADRVEAWALALLRCADQLEGEAARFQVPVDYADVVAVDDCVATLRRIADDLLGPDGPVASARSRPRDTETVDPRKDEK